MNRFLLAAVAAAVLSSAPAKAAPPALTAQEFKLWKEYTAALQDERVQKIPEKKRMKAIADNFKVKEKELADAVAKGEQLGGGAAKASEDEVKTSLEAGALKGRIVEVDVDDSQSHVVTYVSWKNDDGAKLEEEAALVALVAAKGAPITSTVAIWALDAKSGRRVFEAKISAESASKFVEARLAMFASARYIKQFEGVKNAYKGTPPTQQN